MPDLQLGCSAVLSHLAGKGGVRPHISKPSVLLRPSVSVQEFTGWELASNPGSWEAAARAQRGQPSAAGGTGSRGDLPSPEGIAHCSRFCLLPEGGGEQQYLAA